MKIYFENLGANIINIPDDTLWHLYTRTNEHEESVIEFELAGCTFELGNCWEYIQGEGQLSTYAVSEFYNAVVGRVFEMLEEGPVKFINLERVKDEIMPSFWAKWRECGWVQHRHWK